MSLGSCFSFVSSGARWCRAGWSHCRSSVASLFSSLKTKLEVSVCGVRNRSPRGGSHFASSRSFVYSTTGNQVLPKTQEPVEQVLKRTETDDLFKTAFGIDRNSDQPAPGLREEGVGTRSDKTGQDGQAVPSASRLARNRWPRDIKEAGQKWKAKFQANAGPGYADAPRCPVLSPGQQAAQVRETAERVNTIIRHGGRVEVVDLGAL